MHPTDTVLKAIADHGHMISAMTAERSFAADIARAAETIASSLRSGGGVLVFGNGGSAADAQHISGELVGRFAMERKGLRAVALTTDASVMTSLSNDYGYDAIFARQIEALGRPGDIALAISTSGNSPNILRGIETAKKNGMTVIGLSGRGGGLMRDICDILIVIPSDDTPRIQEGHTLVYHILCGLVEAELFGA